MLALFFGLKNLDAPASVKPITSWLFLSEWYSLAMCRYLIFILDSEAPSQRPRPRSVRVWDMLWCPTLSARRTGSFIHHFGSKSKLGDAAEGRALSCGSWDCLGGGASLWCSVVGSSAFGSSYGQGPECYKRGALRERGIRVKYALDKFASVNQKNVLAEINFSWEILTRSGY